MKSYVALLRGVNLAGARKVAMSDLRATAERVGVRNASTLLNSGNLVFRDHRTANRLETLLEAEAQRSLGLATEFFVRSDAEWRDIIAANPFVREAKEDPGHLVLLLLKQPTTAAKVKALQASIAGQEQVRGAGRHVYCYYGDGIGSSRLTSAVLDRMLGARGTGRNWNTVLKLAQLQNATPA